MIAAAGYKLSVWAWVLGAVIAIADGLVWAELGAAFPLAGGSYAFLREIYGPKGAGNWLSFLYVWQLSFTAPLSIASGCIGLSGFLACSGRASMPLQSLRCPSALCQLCCGGSVPAGHGAALSQHQLRGAHGLGAVCRSDGGDCRGDRFRICPRCGDGRLAHARGACLSARRWRLAGSRKLRCLPPIATGATTTSAFSAAKCAGRSALFPAPF